MHRGKHGDSPLVSVALLKFKDAAAWQVALKILDEAGIRTVCDGGIGMIEVCVAAEQAKQASVLLNKAPELIGKLYSPDDLRTPLKAEN